MKPIPPSLESDLSATGDDHPAQRYELVDRIAVGGMAEVFRAKTFGAHGFEKTLAIKRILPELARDQEFEKRFIAEAKISVTLSHANIVQVLDFSRFGDSLYIVMEYVDGLDVSRLLELAAAAERHVPVGAALNIAIELFKALAFAHKREVIHRDVSPSNVLISLNGAAKLADFGIAQAIDGERLSKFRIVGKWPFMSPEQSRGEVLDVRSDLFSAGALLYELFTGVRAFPGTSVEEIVAQLGVVDIAPPSSLRPELPAGLDSIIMGLLRPRREDRSGSAKETVARLVELSYESSIPATSESVVECLEELVAIDAHNASSVSSAILIDDIISSELGSGETIGVRTEGSDEFPLREVTLGLGSYTGIRPRTEVANDDYSRRTLPSDTAPSGLPDDSDLRRTILTVVRRKDGIAEWVADAPPNAPHPPTAVALSARGGLVAAMRRKGGALGLAGLLLVAGAGVAFTGMRGGDHARAIAPVLEVAKPLPAKPVVALLPFAIQSDHADLDFASSGLPQLLGRSLSASEGIRVLDYYQLQASLPSESATPEQWQEAARELGATLLVRGLLDTPSSPASDDQVMLTLVLENADGKVIKEIVERTNIKELPAQVRRAASLILSTIVAETLQDDGGPSFETERGYQLGIAALERDEFGTAARLFREVTEADPDFAEAHYHLALSTWWSSVDIPEVLHQVDLALAGTLSDNKRAFLIAMRPLAVTKFPEAIDAFRAAAAEFPDDKIILYGFFEALFHGGYPEEAAQVYRRIRKIAPTFRLGIMHPISYYASRNDKEGLEWSLRHLQDDTRNRFWRVRAHVADGKLDQAENLIASIRQGLAGPVEAGEESRLKQELAAILAQRGDLSAALALVERGEIYQQWLAGWGIAQAMGTPAQGARWREQAWKRLEGARSDYQRMAELLDVGIMEVLSGDKEAMARTLELIDTIAPEFRPSMGLQELRLMLTDSLGSDALVAELVESPYPVVRAEALAFGHESAGRYDLAVEAWRDAISHEESGRFLTLQNFYLARVAGKAKDWNTVIAATSEILRPRLFYWSWASAVGPAQIMAAKAHEELQEPGEAEALYDALLSARVGARSDDVLVSVARAAMGRLGKTGSSQSR